MSEKLLLRQPLHYDWIFDTFDRGSEEARARFLEQAHKRILHANSPLEVAQKALQANSPLEVAQKALQTDSPEEVALKFIQSEEQVDRLLELLQQRKLALS